MPKQLPDEWVSGKKKSLNVATDLGLRGVPAGNLVIYKCPPSKNSKLLMCRWLPSSGDAYAVEEQAYDSVVDHCCPVDADEATATTPWTRRTMRATPGACAAGRV